MFVLVLLCITLTNCVHSSFAITLKRKGKLVALLIVLQMYDIPIDVLLLFLTVPLVGLQCVIVVFPDHTHVLFKYQHISCKIDSLDSVHCCGELDW